VRRICEGYEEARKILKEVRQGSTVLQPPILLPKDTSKLQPVAYPPVSSMSEKSIFFGCSVTARQHSYQDLLNLTYGVDLSPQACILNTSIRHAVIAIAALSMISRGHH
jgi:hypothetical protein